MSLFREKKTGARGPRFTGTSTYIASEALQRDVNAAMQLQRPLLVKGEPGTGKTQLAYAISDGLQLPRIEWRVKSTTKAHNGRYSYDAVRHLNDSQLARTMTDPAQVAALHARVNNTANYIRHGPLWEAFDNEQLVLLLIDEIDKAELEFPNDLLQELEDMEFDVHELGLRVKAKKRPVVVITSNNEKKLPDAFLRRCIFHFIAFPSEREMATIVHAHYPDIERNLLERALSAFYRLRNVQGVEKKPSTAEFLDWLALLMAGTDLSRNPELRTLPFLGALIKDEKDLAAVLSSERR